MYRHFAIISLTLTACLAMFANTEHHEREAHDDGNGAQHETRQEVQPQKKKQPFTFKDNRRTKGSFGEDSFVGPSRRGSIAISETVTGPELVAADQPLFPDDSNIDLPGAVHGLPPGMTPEEIREWRRLHKKKKNAEPTGQSAPDASDITAMSTVSKTR